VTEGNLDRTCGTCHACCIVLGIEELKKHTNQACKHLDGRDPEHRCSIYDRRPKACSEYTCAWRQGLFEEDFSPQQVGFVATAYEQGWSLMVFDARKAGGLAAGHVKTAVQRILMGPQIDIRIAYLETGLFVFMTKGNIYQGKLLRTRGYEDMTFECGDKPVGRYEMRQVEEAT
jgi:hypothetical protein